MGISVDKRTSDVASGLTVLAILCIMAVGIPAIIVLRHFGGATTGAGAWRWSIAGVVALLILYVVSFNLCAGLLPGPDGRGRSGLALIGSVFVLAGAFVVPAGTVAGVLLLVAFVLDLGGVHWCAYAVARELMRPRAGPASAPGPADEVDA